MKNRILLLLLFALFAGSASAQLKTVRNYHGFSDKLAEVYTVKAGTGTKQGNYKSYAYNGNLILDCNFSNNVLHGAFKRYSEYVSRQLMVSGSYNQGEKNGEWKEWDKKDGGDFYLRRVTTYLNGEERAIKTYTWNGKLVQDVNYNGRYFDADVSRFKNAAGSSRAKREGTMKNGELDGELTDTYEDGTVYKTNWRDGRQEGKATSYYGNGQVSYEGEYLSVQRGSAWEPKRVGKLTQWYEDGTLKEDTEYSNNGKETIISQKIYTDKGALEKETILDQSKSLVYVTIYDPKTGAKSYTVEHKPGSAATEYIRKIEYYPSGKMKSEQFKEPTNGIWEKTYLEDGTLVGATLTDGSIAEYHPNGKLKRKIFKPATLTANTKTFEEYDTNGNKIEEGLMDKNNNVLETTYYTDGMKVAHFNEKTRLMTGYDPEGHITNVSDPVGNTTTYDATGKVVYKLRRSLAPYDTAYPPSECVGFYPNGQIKEKGRWYDRKKIGKWYLYSETGKLSSIWENGAERKPNKGEKDNHAQYLQDLANSKPLK